ncbi:hypothetical protein GGR56DRAFT_655106 [Xylariaceae sp. FL0804]|nr:hypothetical protein GGR56DRAFT_655106 [Xylariaceae sp. FL0804]
MMSMVGQTYQVCVYLPIGLRNSSGQSGLALEAANLGLSQWRPCIYSVPQIQLAFHGLAAGHVTGPDLLDVFHALPFRASRGVPVQEVASGMSTEATIGPVHPSPSPLIAGNMPWATTESTEATLTIGAPGPCDGTSTIANHAVTRQPGAWASSVALKIPLPAHICNAGGRPVMCQHVSVRGVCRRRRACVHHRWDSQATKIVLFVLDAATYERTRTRLIIHLTVTHLSRLDPGFDGTVMEPSIFT